MSYTGKLCIRNAASPKEIVKEFEINRSPMCWDNATSELIPAVGDGKSLENIYFGYWNISLRDAGSYELVMNVLDGERVVISTSIALNVSGASNRQCISCRSN